MKVIVLKKTALIITICVLVVLTAFTLNFGGLNLASIYLNSYTSTNRKLPIYSVQTDENKVAISFDAAWGADKTREIMAICKRHNVNATFFLVGFWIEEYPDMVKEIYNNGFEIGLHSNTHPDMTTLSESEMREELETNIRLVEELTGYTPKLFRPPYGYYNNTLIEVCEDLGLSCIEWSVDSHDWMGISASELSGRVISRAKSGSIVLFHNNSDNIIEGLEMVLTYFDEKAIQVVPVGELIYYDDYTIDIQGTQIKN